MVKIVFSEAATGGVLYKKVFLKFKKFTGKHKDTVDKYKEIMFGSDVVCKDCLNELKKQRKIAEYTRSKKLLEQTVRDLSCQFVLDHCFHTRTLIDGEMTVCMDCGLILEESEVSSEGDFLSHKVKRR